MRKFLLAGASAALLAASTVVVQSDPSGAVRENADSSSGNAGHVEPGKVGPGSERNSQVSPTSPDIPAHAQPPPDINLPADSGSSGSGSGEHGQVDTKPAPDRWPR